MHLRPGWLFLLERAKAYAVTISTATSTLISVLTFFEEVTRHLWSVCALAASPAVVTAALAIEFNTRRRSKFRQRIARKLVDIIHSKCFADQHGLIDRDYRVSLFIKHNDAWRCEARSDNSQARCAWAHVEEASQLAVAGLVVSAAVEGRDFYALGLPEGDREDPERRAKYFRAARLSENVNDQRSWPFATVYASVMREQHGAIFGVFVIERKSGRPLLDVAEGQPSTHIGTSSDEIRPADRSTAVLHLSAVQMAIQVASAAWE